MQSSYTQNKIEVTQLTECLQQYKRIVRLSGSNILSLYLMVLHDIINNLKLPLKHEALRKLFGPAKCRKVVSTVCVTICTLDNVLWRPAPCDKNEVLLLLKNLLRTRRTKQKILLLLQILFFRYVVILIQKSRCLSTNFRDPSVFFFEKPQNGRSTATNLRFWCSVIKGKSVQMTCKRRYYCSIDHTDFILFCYILNIKVDSSG